jgi:hypothetical protein
MTIRRSRPVARSRQTSAGVAWFIWYCAGGQRFDLRPRLRAATLIATASAWIQGPQSRQISSRVHAR